MDNSKSILKTTASEIKRKARERDFSQKVRFDNQQLDFETKIYI